MAVEKHPKLLFCRKVAAYRLVTDLLCASKRNPAQIFDISDKFFMHASNAEQQIIPCAIIASVSCLAIGRPSIGNLMFGVAGFMFAVTSALNSFVQANAASIRHDAAQMETLKQLEPAEKNRLLAQLRRYERRELRTLLATESGKWILQQSQNSAMAHHSPLV